VRIALSCVIAAAVLAAAGIAARTSSWAMDSSQSLIERGRYLTDAGDCVACHTADKGRPFAGGRPIETPFGVIYSPNLTSDRATGIGAWSDEDFYRAMHFGVGPDGTRLYPAFPYPYFTKMTRDDVLAIRAYLATLPPVKNARPANELTWPLNYRVFMRGWDWMFFTPGQYVPNTHKSPEWNRGAYLAEGPAHCGACHTPKNIAGADKTDEKLTGARLQNWFAPKLADDKHNGLGGWSVDDIVEYLKTGRNRYSGATGLMAEVVTNSTSKLTDADLRAIAVYLKDVSAEPPATPDKPDQTAMNAGAAIYADSCAACHQGDGTGVPRMFPPLAGNANVKSADPTSIIRVILQGAQTVPTDQQPTPSTMPAFDWKLSDAQIAAVATYVRNHWGNAAPPVAADQVASLRTTLQPKTH
jgi:cbb3-type cytochrome c oxidase subunit III